MHRRKRYVLTQFFFFPSHLFIRSGLVRVADGVAVISSWTVSAPPSFSFYIFSIPFIILAFLVPLPPSRTSDPGSHSRLFYPPPLRTTARALHSYCDKGSVPSSRVNSSRIVPTHDIIGALDSWCHLRIKNSIRRFEPMTSSNTIKSSIRG